IPLAAARFVWLRAVASVAVGVVGLYAASQLEAVNVAALDAQQGTMQLLSALDARGLHHGYAGYWQGDLLTWQSAGSLESRAVIQDPGCQPTSPGWFCPYTRNTYDSWFEPRPGPSFLAVENGSSFLGQPLPSGLTPRDTL